MFVEFQIVGVASAQTLPRILEHFALRDLTPSRVSAEIADGSTHIIIRQAAMTFELAEIVAEKMRSGVLIEHVQVAAID